MIFNRISYVKPGIECRTVQKLAYSVLAGWEPYPNEAKNSLTAQIAFDAGVDFKKNIEATNETPPDIYYPEAVAQVPPFKNELALRYNYSSLADAVTKLVGEIRNTQPHIMPIQGIVFMREWWAKLPVINATPELLITDQSVNPAGGACIGTNSPVDVAIKFRWANHPDGQAILEGSAFTSTPATQISSGAGECEIIATLPEGEHMMPTNGNLYICDFNFPTYPLANFSVNVVGGRMFANESVSQFTPAWNAYEEFNFGDLRYLWRFTNLQNVPETVGGNSPNQWPNNLSGFVWLTGLAKGDMYYFPRIISGVLDTYELKESPLGYEYSTYSGDFNAVVLDTTFIPAEDFGADTVDEVVNYMVANGYLPNFSDRISIKFTVDYDALPNFGGGQASFNSDGWEQPPTFTQIYPDVTTVSDATVVFRYSSDGKATAPGSLFRPLQFVPPNQQGNNADQFNGWSFPPLKTILRFQNYARPYLNPLKKVKPNE